MNLIRMFALDGRFKIVNELSGCEYYIGNVKIANSFAPLEPYQVKKAYINLLRNSESIPFTLGELIHYGISMGEYEIINVKDDHDLERVGIIYSRDDFTSLAVSLHWTYVTHLTKGQPDFTSCLEVIPVNDYADYDSIDTNEARAKCKLRDSAIYLHDKLHRNINFNALADKLEKMDWNDHD